MHIHFLTNIEGRGIQDFTTAPKYEVNCIMMKWVFTGVLFLSLIFGAGTGRMREVTGAALDGGTNAIQTFLYLLGGMCLWGGLMRVAEKAGLTQKLCRLFQPVAKRIFVGLNLKGKAFQCICLNVAANLLGLGNAATPLGMEAMRQLEREEGASATASRNMILFVVLNTASITLIPSTTATLRMKYGAAQPLDILPAVLITSAASVTIGLFLAMLFHQSNSYQSNILPDSPKTWKNRAKI